MSGHGGGAPDLPPGVEKDAPRYVVAYSGGKGSWGAARYFLTAYVAGV